MAYEFPRDLRFWSFRKGSQWFGAYRLPWKAGPQIVQDKAGKPEPFQSSEGAKDAAGALMCHHFKDKCLGTQDGIPKGAKAEIERVFGQA